MLVKTPATLFYGICTRGVTEQAVTLSYVCLGFRMFAAQEKAREYVESCYIDEGCADSVLRLIAAERGVGPIVNNGAGGPDSEDKAGDSSIYGLRTYCRNSKQVY